MEKPQESSVIGRKERDLAAGLSLRRTRIPGERTEKEDPLSVKREKTEAAMNEGLGLWSRYRAVGVRWWEDWREISTGKTLLTDPLAGLTVAAVALPLNVALAIAAGLPASAGLWAGAVGGLVAAFFGGSSLQATGSAAALNVMVAAIVTKYGQQGAYGAAFLVGLLQVVIAFTLIGGLARFIPEVVLAGFTTGVGLKLMNTQLPELLDVDHSVLYLLQNLRDPSWLHDVSWTAVVCGLFTVFVMIVGKPWKRFPAALAGLAIATFVSAYLGWKVHRVGEIAAGWPSPSLPQLPWESWVSLAVDCFALGILATVESLISARAVDGMAKGIRPHEPNLEVLGQGLGNIAAGLVGAPPVSGVIVRSSVNAQSGAKTRLAAILHGVFLMGATFWIGKELALVPIAALAGLLCVIGFRLLHIGDFVHLLRSDRVAALSFLLALAGVLSDHLMIGLVLAGLLQGLVEWRRARAAGRVLAAQKGLGQGIRAVISAHDPHEARAEHRFEARSPDENWELHVSQRPQVHATAFVHPNASVIGRVVLDERVHVAAEASLRADEGTPFYLGPETNIQDGVVLHALKGKWVRVGSRKWAIYIGRSVSVAHQALIHGPCFIGEQSFVGFKAVVHDSVLGRGCFVGIGATVVGVEVPEGRYVPHGTVVDSPEKVAALPLVQEHHRHFNEDVVEVNTGLIEAYRAQEDDTLALESQFPGQSRSLPHSQEVL